MKKKHSGDGGRFQAAVLSSEKTVADLLEAMNTSMGTFYRLYKKDVWTDDEKLTAAKALNLPVDKIFNTPKEVIPIGKHIPVRGAPEWAGLPMYNVPITASFIATYRDESYMQPLYYFDDPRFKDCDFGAIITGDSMHSEIRHGDYIACKEVTDIGFIVFGEIYYVVAKNGLETCKYINAHPTDENRLLLVPRNEKISPSPIPKDMILKLYKVRGIIRGY